MKANNVGRCLQAGAGILLIAGTANANLLLNGSFETGSFTGQNPNSDSGTTQLLNGSSQIGSWVVSGGVGGDIAWLQVGNPWSLNPSDGNRFLDLTGYNNDNQLVAGGLVLSQTVSTTPNQQYVLSFDIGSSHFFDASKASPSIMVYVNGSPAFQSFAANSSLADAGGNNHWQNQSFTFTALGSSASITFQGLNPGGAVHLGLDNVSFSAVPEPTTMVAGALLLIPFGASAFRRFRKA